MLLQPLEQFVCDECGAIILTPWDGLIEWVNIPDEKGEKSNWISHHPSIQLFSFQDGKTQWMFPLY